jgi:hypothetical protein
LFNNAFIHYITLWNGSADVIKEPFTVFNADDFYGQESFKILADFLTSVSGKQKTKLSS